MSYCIKEVTRRLPFLLVLVLAAGLVPTATAQTGSCTPALGEAYLDVNNVRARILNNGGLFYRGEPHVYEVPKGGGATALFAGGFWIGGLVDGQLRMASTRYGPWEFWAGPIDELGNPPADCSVYDKIWKIGKVDIDALNAGDGASLNLATWPTGLGAPTLAPAEGDGIDNNNDGEIDEPGEMKQIHKEILQLPLSQRINRVIDLAAGERPELLGDQMLWWIMNDRGNVHNHSDTPPIGVEVHALAFAFNQSGDLGNTTFYKVNVFMKADDPLTEAYVSLWSDPDLGDFQDDYVGSDTTLGLGFVYNSDNLDGSAQGYGEAPPALGYDFFQGPIVPSTGDTAHVSGVKVPDFRNLKMTSFMRFNNGGGPMGDPGTGTEVYNFMQSRLKDGRPVLAFGDGLPSTGTYPEAQFMFPGDPASGEFWSEVNSDDAGNALTPADRRFIMTAGPFTVNPGDQQEIVYGIVWARGTDNLNSVQRVRSADAFAQSAFDANFFLPAPPDAPTVKYVALDRQIAIEWGNEPTSNNYLDSYREFNPLIDPSDPDYVLEGYEVYQFTSAQDQDGTLIATYDIDNAVGAVFEDPDGDGIPTRTADGKNEGIRHGHIVSALTNYTTYYFGVRAYAYNANANPQVYRSPFVRTAIYPAKSTAVISDAATEAVVGTAEPDLVATGVGIGEGVVTADVVNPGSLVEAEYRVEFYSLPEGAPNTSVVATADDEVDALPAPGGLLNGKRIGSADAGKSAAAGETTYNVLRGTEVVFDGSATGEPAPQGSNLFVADGLEFSVQGPEPGIKNFLVVSNAAGPLDPFEIGTFAFNGNGFPFYEGNDRPSSAQQVGEGAWGISHGGGDDATFASYYSRAFETRSQGFSRLGAYDYEIRFTDECAAANDGTTVLDGTDCLGWAAFDDGSLHEVPFEIWQTGINTPNDPSDDKRLIPAVLEHCGTPGVFDICDDDDVSGGDNDPYTDWIYFFQADDGTLGETGYECFMFGACGGEEIIGRQIIVNWNGGSAPPYNQDLPEPGTTFRYVTLKPSQPGDYFTFSTTGLGATAASLELQQERLEDIGIVPNPYKGASTYEVSQLIDEVRFTNLPDVATIRVFTLNGTLLRTIFKNSPGQRSLTWDLTTDTQLPLSSGMYLIHVDVPDVGEHVIKFGVVKKRIQLNVF